MQSVKKIDIHLSRTIIERGKEEVFELTSNQADFLAGLRSFPSNKKAFYLEKSSRDGNNEYRLRAKGCAGVVNLETLQILVRPRLSKEASESNEQLLKLMAFAYEWPELKFADISDLGAGLGLFDWLVRGFHLEIKRVIQKGLWRKFRSIPKESRYIRGRLDIQRQIALTLQRPGVFACRPTKHTAAVPENLLLQSALGFAGRNCQSVILRSQSRAFARDFEAATQMTEPHTETAQIVLDRLNSYYRTAITLAQLVLAKVGPTHRTGEMRFFSFLIDMWALFERFMVIWLKRRFSGTVGQSPLSLKVTSDGIALSATIIPDIVIYRNGTPLIVADTKYASFPIRGQFGKETFNMSHIYQMATYCTHFHCDGVLLYPSGPGMTTSPQTVHLPSGHRIFVREVLWDKMLDENSLESQEVTKWFSHLILEENEAGRR